MVLLIGPINMILFITSLFILWPTFYQDVVRTSRNQSSNCIIASVGAMTTPLLMDQVPQKSQVENQHLQSMEKGHAD